MIHSLHVTVRLIGGRTAPRCGFKGVEDDRPYHPKSRKMRVQNDDQSTRNETLEYLQFIRAEENWLSAI